MRPCPPHHSCYCPPGPAPSAQQASDGPLGRSTPLSSTRLACSPGLCASSRPQTRGPQGAPLRAGEMVPSSFAHLFAHLSPWKPGPASRLLLCPAGCSQAASQSPLVPRAWPAPPGPPAAFPLGRALFPSAPCVTGEARPPWVRRLSPPAATARRPCFLTGSDALGFSPSSLMTIAPL